MAHVKHCPVRGNVPSGSKLSTSDLVRSPTKLCCLSQSDIQGGMRRGFHAADITCTNVCTDYLQMYKCHSGNYKTNNANQLTQAQASKVHPNTINLTTILSNVIAPGAVRLNVALQVYIMLTSCQNTSMLDPHLTQLSLPDKGSRELLVLSKTGLLTHHPDIRHASPVRTTLICAALCFLLLNSVSLKVHTSIKHILTPWALPACRALHFKLMELPLFTDITKLQKYE